VAFVMLSSVEALHPCILPLPSGFGRDLTSLYLLSYVLNLVDDIFSYIPHITNHGSLSIDLIIFFF
jgi:hypothetical protein